MSAHHRRKHRRPRHATRPLPRGRFTATVERIADDGRGIAHINGKTTFIRHALIGETVEFTYQRQHRRFDEGEAVAWQTTSPERVSPPCPHISTCGGCTLQHWDDAAQRHHKQTVLAQQLAHFGGVQPAQWAAPLKSQPYGYRRRARLAVDASGEGLPRVGFRQQGSHAITDMQTCGVLDTALDNAILPLRHLVAKLSDRARLKQIEIVKGDEHVAIVFRMTRQPPSQDQQQLLAFCEQRQWFCYLQTRKDQPATRVDALAGEPSYVLPAYDLTMHFHPQDFLQANAAINRQMINQAVQWLDVQPQHRVLDLFCGLGNFTLPLARQAGKVVGVELSEAMVQRAQHNAEHNGLNNTDFMAVDLSVMQQPPQWLTAGFDRVLLDPPRAGAAEVIPWLAASQATRIVYVSCNAATLARDAGQLVNQGYQLINAGIMDMFPQTAHLEAMALFERKK